MNFFGNDFSTIDLGTYLGYSEDQKEYEQCSTCTFVTGMSIKVEYSCDGIIDLADTSFPDINEMVL